MDSSNSVYIYIISIAVIIAILIYIIWAFFGTTKVRKGNWNPDQEISKIIAEKEEETIISSNQPQSIHLEPEDKFKKLEKERLKREEERVQALKVPILEAIQTSSLDKDLEPISTKQNFNVDFVKVGIKNEQLGSLDSKLEGSQSTIKESNTEIADKIVHQPAINQNKVISNQFSTESSSFSDQYNNQALLSNTTSQVQKPRTKLLGDVIDTPYDNLLIVNPKTGNLEFRLESRWSTTKLSTSVLRHNLVELFSTFVEYDENTRLYGFFNKAKGSEDREKIFVICKSTSPVQINNLSNSDDDIYGIAVVIPPKCYNNVKYVSELNRFLFVISRAFKNCFVDLAGKDVEDVIRIVSQRAEYIKHNS